MRRMRSSGIAVVWIVVGVVIAARYDYFEVIERFEHVLSALLAILLWPLLFLGVDFNVDL